MKHTLIKLFILLVFILPMACIAQEDRNRKPPSARELIEKMDQNDDTMISKSEIKGPLKNDFDKVDLNGDGFLTEEELNKAPKPKRNHQSQRR